MWRQACPALVRLAAAGVAVGGATASRAADAGRAAGLPSTARQAACAALLVPAKCAALDAVLSKREIDGALARALAPCVVALSVTRAAVGLADDQAAEAYLWTRLLVARAVSVVIRFGIVAASAWQLARSWDNASLLLETRFLAAAVALDAGVATVHAARLAFFYAAYQLLHELLAADPPTYLFSAATKLQLKADVGGGGPVVLRDHLLVLEREGDFLSTHLQQKTHTSFLTGPSSLLWMPVVFLIFLMHFLGGVRRRAASLLSRSSLDSRDDAFYLHKVPIVLFCTSAHLDDPAAAVLDDHLPPYMCGRDAAHAQPLQTRAYTHTTQIGGVELYLRLELGLRQRRLWALAHRLSHANNARLLYSTAAVHQQ